MTISTDTRPSGALLVVEQRRAGRELVLEKVFQPLSSLLLPLLVRLRLAPPAVVLANAAAGLTAAVAIAGEELVVGAVLLQVKTLLDNCDGRLARATGRVTLAGRYLDTIADLVVNAAVFAALAYTTGMPLLAVAAFFALMLVLSADVNVSELAHSVAGGTPRHPRPTGGTTERVLATLYRLLFHPQDRLLRLVSARRFEAATGEGGTPAAEHAYFDSATVTVLANLGLTTQLAVLGACLVFGAPALYLWLAVGSFLALVPLQLRRERLARRAVRAG